MERLAPGAPVVHAQLGALLAQSGAHEEALLHLRQAVTLDPGDPDARFNLGIALAARGRLEESIDHFRAADALLPEDPATVYHLGMSLRLAGRPEEAAAQFRRVLRVEPGHVGAANELGGVLLVQGRVAEAADQFRGALALAPNSARLHYGLAAALRLGGGDMSEVQDHLRQAMRFDPRWPQPFNDLAWLLATSPDTAMRDPESALRLAEQAVALSGGNDPTVLDTRAAAEAASGRFAAAIETERRAVELATAAKRDALVATLSERMRLYQRGVAYVERGRVRGPR
jgi:Flp pilus assembly protein TadD